MSTYRHAAGHAAKRAGPGAEPSFRQPMAIVVIGGLMTSTVLSLLLVPVVFTYVDDMVKWLQQALGRRGQFAQPYRRLV